MILVSGECPTYLNTRLDLVNIKITFNPGDKDDIIINELALLALVNQKYRKSSKSWGLRQTLLRKLTFFGKNPEENKVSYDDTESLFVERLKKELQHCDKCNVHEPRNYYVWMHRLFLMN